MATTQKDFPFLGYFQLLLPNFKKINHQWGIHRASDAHILLWTQKLCAQTKEKLIQKISGI